MLQDLMVLSRERGNGIPYGFLEGNPQVHSQHLGSGPTGHQQEDIRGRYRHPTLGTTCTRYPDPLLTRPRINQHLSWPLQTQLFRTLGKNGTLLLGLGPF